MRIRRFIAAAAATAALAVGGLALTASPANAGSFGAQGPAHTHEQCSIPPNGSATCARWILANGAIIQGPLVLMNSQYGYVLVWCSTYTSAYGGSWGLNTTAWGPWGNTGLHPYCQNPTYTYTYRGVNGVHPWSLKPA